MNLFLWNRATNQLLYLQILGQQFILVRQMDLNHDNMHFYTSLSRKQFLVNHKYECFDIHYSFLILP
jgi:hypothetical protein